MIRDDHRIMIEQDVGSDNHYTILWLIDIAESKDADSTGNTTIYGRWRHTADSYDDEMILFTSANKQWLYWEWTGGPHGGDLSIGVKMKSASHREDQEDYFQVLMVLSGAQRQSNGKFKISGVLDRGSGMLNNDVGAPGGGKHFTKGQILWSVAESGHPWGRSLNP